MCTCGATIAHLVGARQDAGQGCGVKMGYGSSRAHRVPDHREQRRVGLEQRALLRVGRAEHEGPGQVRAVAVDHGRQVDDDQSPDDIGLGLCRPWSMHVSRPTLT